MTELTDPATEMHKLCITLRAYRHSGATHQALAEVFGVSDESAAYFQILGHIAGRFSRLSALYENSLDDPARSLGMQTIKHLQSVLSANRQRRPWEETKAHAFDEVRLTSLVMSAPLIRMKAPLTIPTADERAGAIARIDDAIKALSSYHGAISAAFSSSLWSIRQTLERLDIYGVDGFTEEFLRAFAVRTAAEREHDVPEPERRARNSAWIVITLVAGLLVSSDAIITAVENHYARSEKVIQLLVGETKLLPPPSTNDSGEARNAIVPTRTKPTRQRGSRR